MRTKAVLLVALLAVILAGCTVSPESTTYSGNGLQIDQIGQRDGCTVYRFLDASQYVWFVKCDNTVTTSYHVGKSGHSTVVTQE